MNPPLFDIVDALYQASMKVTPKFLEDRPMFTAFSYGAVGMFFVTKYLHNAIEKTAPEFYKNHMQKLDAIVPTLVVAAPILYSFFDPQGAQEMMMQHPVYTAGMTGLAAGAMFGCVDATREKDQKLQE